MRIIVRFARAEAGTVTVDWVVLCAAVIAFVVFATNLLGTNAVTAVDASVAATAGIGG
jgi:hypothetical protein